ncbi:MAG: NAD-dependent epimerase/dehydratase family protein [Candidatus Nanopelagicus sp.]
MKKVLITGCSGYIGSHLIKMLSNDYEVHGLDVNIPQADGLREFYQHDIRKLIDLPTEFDAVIHLAALVNVGESERMPIQYYITNLNGTMNVLSKIKTKNFIFASTGAAQDCESAYGISKRAAEDVVREYCTQHKPTPYTTFRFYNVIGSDGFGPTNPDGLMHNLMSAKERGEFTIFGTDYSSHDGTCVRDYVHVNEICDALQQAIEKPSNQIECLGHGVGNSVRDIVSLYKKTNNVDFEVKTGPRRKGDIASSVLDNVSPYMKNLYTMEQLLKV